MRRVASYKTKITRGSAQAVAPNTKAILQLMRFDPTTNTKRIETYEYDKKNDFMVLDLLTAVKAHQDPSLAFRASCCEGVCGSCAMNINGVNSLACVTFATPVTTVGPLPNFPIIKDFVVDLRNFFKQYEYIRPFVRNVNLPQCHIDNVYQRYTATCKALYGTSPEEAKAQAALPVYSGETNTSELLEYLRLLDATVASGNVTNAVVLLKSMRGLGYTLNNTETKELLETALKNAGA